MLIPPQNIFSDKKGGVREGFALKKGGTLYPYAVFRTRRIAFILLNRVENQNEPKRPQSGGRLGSFWFSTRFTRKTLDYSNGTYLYSQMNESIGVLKIMMTTFFILFLCFVWPSICCVSHAPAIQYCLRVCVDITSRICWSHKI